MGYMYDDFYYEPSEFEIQIDEFKQGLMKSVKQEILDEINKLKNENKELQSFKLRKEQIEREHRNKLIELQNRAIEAERTASRAKLVELLGEYFTVAWGVKNDYVALPKCDKCDDKRYIHFKSPSGKNLTEQCACDKKKCNYIPQELSLIKFYAKRKDRAGKEQHVERHYKKVESILSDYDEYDDTSNLYNGEEFENANRYGIVFLEKDKCQEYCNYLNQKEVTND